MDTGIDVTVVTTMNAAALVPIWCSIDSFLTDWDARYSDSGKVSEVWALNHRSSPVVPVSHRLGGMIADALRYGDTTNGMFDITVLPLKELWGLGYVDKTERVPPPDSLRLTLGRVGYRFVHINAARDAVSFDKPDVVVDAGGFAKGYGLIRIGEILHEKGFENYLVAAGDIVGRGRRPNGTSWVIGIQHPRKSDSLLATVPLDSGAIFTSGDYERHWQSNPLVHHIFNPKTGHSCTRNQSLTIWSMDPLQAKFLSTGLFGWRSDSIMAFVQKRGLETMIVDSVGKVMVSPGWKRKVKMLQ
jgi:FAD:protein FMN transferase